MGMAVGDIRAPSGSQLHARPRPRISQFMTCQKTNHENRAVSSECLSEHSYGVWPVKRAGVIRPAVRGVRFGEGSASAVVDVCVATHMRGLVPHDRVCEMRSGAVLWRRAWPVGLLAVFSRVAPRVVAPVRSPRRAVAGGGYSIVASAQQCPASSRATATTTIVRGLPRPSSACQRP